MNDDYFVMSAWAIDFVRAVNGRNRFARWLFKIAVGKYAYREFIGLHNTMHEAGFYPDLPYELEHMDYHGDGERLIYTYGDIP